jgi:hypothetical protein
MDSSGLKRIVTEAGREVAESRREVPVSALDGAI